MLILHFIFLAPLPAWDESITVCFPRIVISEDLSLSACQHMSGALVRGCIFHYIDLRKTKSIGRRADTKSFLFHSSHGRYCSPKVLILISISPLRSEATNEVYLALRELKQCLLIITLGLFICGVEELMILG
jgi:hypothetical protein